MAQLYFDSEAVFVGLIEEDKEEFLSCQGADVEWLPREETVCSFQILSDGEMVIENTEEDARLDENDTIRELGLSSYAGAPMVAPSGERIGSFCVMDTEPRTYTEEDREMLRLLAEEATEKLLTHENGSGT